MKITDETTRERLKDVPIEKRVFIYNADIILEFFRETFVPIKYFIKKESSLKPGQQIIGHITDVGEKSAMTLNDLYEMYLLFRNHKPYTADIETKYKFSIIVRNMRWYKNEWEFIVKRRGREQEIVVYPLMLRTRLQQIITKEPVNLSNAQVEVELKDLTNSTEEY